jgi:hypothetical protein
MMGNIIKLPTLKTDNKSVGERSEAMILARLSELGYFVYLPFGENHRSDMIVEDDDGNLHRIQCKTGRIWNGCVVFNACSNNSYHHNGGRRDYRGQIDYFAVYVPDTRKIYMMHVDHASKTECKLRLEPPKNNQEKHVRWAKDYEL